MLHDYTKVFVRRSDVVRLGMLPRLNELLPSMQPEIIVILADLSGEIIGDTWAEFISQLNTAQVQEKALAEATEALR